MRDKYMCLGVFADHGFLSFFFFQAEDGIRDRTVTGVQTCALPISPRVTYLTINYVELVLVLVQPHLEVGRLRGADGVARSEERRVGKECRSRRAADH